MNRRQQDDPHAPREDYDPRGEAPVYSTRRSPRRRRSPARHLVPLLIFAAFGILFARQQVPAFADWWERTFNPSEWQARATCRKAALDDLGDGQYARLHDAGELQHSADGPFVTRMQFSVLDTGGREQLVGYNCYLDSQGRLFRLNRIPE